jgi:Flp pilus assembly protein TadG
MSSNISQFSHSAIRDETMSHFQKKHHRHRGRLLARLGTTSVEFAIVAPVFVFVIAVCGEFARLSMMRNLAQNAAYEAARYVMAEGAKVNDGIAQANQILARLGTRDAIVTINGSTGAVGSGGQVINEITAATASVSCNIEIPLASNSAIIPASFLGNKIVVSGMTLRTERYRGYYDGLSTD